MLEEPVKDLPSVTADSLPIRRLIHGVSLQRSLTHADERGTLCEIFSPSRPLDDLPLVSVYQFTIRPGRVKGWHVHYLHDDRIFLSQGHVRMVLYDDRPDSPTYRQVDEVFQTEYDRNLVRIPAHVYHAIENLGTADALLIGMPTRAYNHSDPDVYRLPLENSRIPYRFVSRRGA